MEIPTIRELMVPLKEYASVSGEARVFEAIEALDRVRERYPHRRFKNRAVLVLDADGRIVGKVRHIEVMERLEPAYDQLLGLSGSGGGPGLEKIQAVFRDRDLWRDPFPEYCRRAADLPVREIMHAFTDSEYVSIDSSLAEAVHQMVMGRHASLLVTRDGEVAGVLRMTDVYSEVCQIIKADRDRPIV